VRNGMKIKGV